MLTFLLFLFLVACGQERFRTILIDRACRQRPSLSFCSDFVLTTTEKVTTTSELSLVVPLPPDEDDSSSLPSSNSSDKVARPKEFDFGNSTTEEEEHVGSLVRLPKPKRSDESHLVPTTEGPNLGAPRTVPPTSSDSGKNSNASAISIEDEKTVMVFVSEYCVVEREHFVKTCHGDVHEDDIPFCKSYPPACSSAAGVIPIVTYCLRYYKQYPRLCNGQKVEQDALQFCFAFEQFCIPELTAAKPVQRPQSSVRKCEDVLPEARKICNPFPHPRDTFNVLRCSNFLTNCKSFVDWAQ